MSPVDRLFPVVRCLSTFKQVSNINRGRAKNPLEPQIKMPSKRYKKSLTVVDAAKTYPLTQAVEVLTKFPRAKFNESVDLAFRLGVDPKQSDQMVRGTTPLPHGSGKTVRVLVFSKPGATADAAKNAGAEFVGFEDMIKKCTEGWTDFDVAIATPEAMTEVRKLGKVLGPRGLMPNPKTGTVTEDLAKAVKEVKAGRVEYKVDKAGNIHVAVGKASLATPTSNRVKQARRSRMRRALSRFSSASFAVMWVTRTEVHYR